MSMLSFVGILAASSLVGVVVQPAHAGGFKVQSLLRADTGAMAVTVVDLNHDGNLDLAEASYLSRNTTSIRVGNGDGSFQSAVTYSVGAQPYSIATADFDSDGNIDLVVANELDDSVSVLLGNGDGTFQPQMVFAATDQPMSVSVGDFNQDGVPDVAVACIGALEVLLGVGDGSLDPAIVADSYGGYTVSVGDFNADGNPDLALGTTVGFGNQGVVQILVGAGDGTFALGDHYSLQVSTPYSVAVGDLNHDGKLDIAVTTFNGGVDVLLGLGDATFLQPVVYITACCASYSVAMSDFNRDGNLDLAVSNYEIPGYVSVLNGKGDGTFRDSLDFDEGGKDPEGLAAGDLNSDGSPDLVVANSSSANVSVLLNTGGTFLRTKSSPNPSKVGQKVTFTAQVRASLSGTGSPTGTVTFKDGTKSAKVTLVNGSATFSTSTLAQGTHTITVSYSGDKNFNSNDAKPLVQVVNP